MQQGQGPARELTEAALSSARARWRGVLRAGMSEDEATRLSAIQVNVRMDVPAAQQGAASAWCVEHAPGAGSATKAAP